MKRPIEMLREFSEKFGAVINEVPTIPDKKTRNLRTDLIFEEFVELNDAFIEKDIVAIADAVADLLYVVYGTALACGLPVDALFAEVHRSNMSKVWPDGSVRVRKDGKILKPDTFSPPDLAPILERAKFLPKLGAQDAILEEVMERTER